MTKNILESSDISSLRRQKGNICVSVIVPTHRLSPERQTDRLTVHDALNRAKEILTSNYSASETSTILRHMNELYQETDFTHNMSGIGYYVSAAVKRSIRFSFPVEENVMVNDHFELRELIYRDSYAGPYWVLLLTEQGGRLFSGNWDNLAEIKNKQFPMVFTDDFVYAKPAHKASYAGSAHVKNFEKDKSETEAIRLTEFFRILDKALESHVRNNIPLVVMGVEKELSAFCAISKHNPQIAGKITGSYGHLNDKELADLAWPVARQHFEDNWKSLTKEFEEKTGEGLGISGIQSVWNAACEGKALRLLVEKDYRRQGFLAEDEKHLYLRPPARTKRVVPDAVEEVIETVLEKNGMVDFVDNGMLKDHQRIAMITRY